MKLSNENIQNTCDSAEEFLLKYSKDKKWMLRIRLIFEEILLQYQSQYGNEIEYEFSNEKKWGKTVLSLKIQSDSFNPFEETDNVLLQNLLKNLGIIPSWRYKNKTNILAFQLQKRNNNAEIIRLVLALVLGIIAGEVALSYPEIGNTIGNSVLAPLCDKILGGLIAFTDISVFLSLVIGIIGMGSINTLKTKGMKIFSVTIKHTIAIIIISIATLIPFSAISSGAGSDLSLLPLYKMFLDIIPTDIVTPFQTGNVLQIFFIALCVGLAILANRNQSENICRIVEEFSAPISSIVSFFSGLMPIVIFISFYQLVVNGVFSQIMVYSKLILLTALVFTVNMAIIAIYICIKKKLSPIKLIKKISPIVILAFMTASSLVCFIPKCEIAEKKLGIKKALIDMEVPMLQIIFPMSMMLQLIPLGFFCMDLYAIPITIGGILVLAVISWLLALSAPPVPGGAIAVYSIFLAQLGIPIEVLAVIVALDVLMDHVFTAVGQFLTMILLVDTADKIKMIDDEILRN